ncbi:MAG: beta-hydroxyacyl-ACP dehydratase [Phycisphaerales bacterium]|nr:beta-hydroxyacyl-ACP dehydratase [Phycisphaerales bacterium]
MYFALIDRVLECSPERVVAIKNVSAAEEYLQDHFPTFPVLPGVLMVEAIVQAGRHMLETHHPQTLKTRMVLGSVRAVKYGRFVKPGETLRVEVVLTKRLDDGSFEFKGQGTVASSGNGHGTGNGASGGGAAGAENGESSGSAISGRFVLRPLGSPC